MTVQFKAPFLVVSEGWPLQHAAVRDLADRRAWSATLCMHMPSVPPHVYDVYRGSSPVCIHVYGSRHTDALTDVYRVCMCVCARSAYFSICLFICLSFCSSGRLPVHPSIHISIHPSIHPSISLHICLSTYLPTYLCPCT